MSHDRACAAAVMLLGMTVVGGEVRASPELRAERDRFVDSAGRTVILRGVNAVYKAPPFHALVEPSELDPLVAAGMNVVRLGVLWEAYEPVRGQYDEAYLDHVVEIADAAAARALWVIVDFHQDAFSRVSLQGCGEGMPPWAAVAVPPAVPDNGAACTDWGARMLSDPGLRQTWDAFFANAEGVRDAWLAMVARVAARLSDRPAVIGYDLLNEPLGDEPSQVAPLHRDAVAVVRAADPSAIIFVSPAAITSSGTPSRLPRPEFGNFAFAPHFYDPSVYAGHRYSGLSLAPFFDQMAGQAAELGGPLFVGELGAEPTTAGLSDYLAALYDELDARGASSAQWVYLPRWSPTELDGWNREDFSLVDEHGAWREGFALRPYAPRVSGTAPRLRVVVSPPEVEVTWNHDPALGQTEIFAPSVFFGGAASVGVEGRGLRCEVRGDRVRCEAAAAGPARVVLRPAGPGGCAVVTTEPLLPILVLAAIALVELGRRRARGRGTAPVEAPR